MELLKNFVPFDDEKFDNCLAINISVLQKKNREFLNLKWGIGNIFHEGHDFKMYVKRKTLLPPFNSSNFRSFNILCKQSTKRSEALKL